MPIVTARDARNDSNQPSAADPLSIAISAAVDAALAARLPEIIDAIKGALPKPEEPGPDRFIKMEKVIDMLGCTRSTVHRRAKNGVYPRIRKQGSTAGYYASDLTTMMAKPDEEVAPGKHTKRAGRRLKSVGLEG